MYTLVVSVSVTDGGDNSSFLNLPQPCNTRMMQRRATLMRGYRLVLYANRFYLFQNKAYFMIMSESTVSCYLMDNLLHKFDLRL